MFGGHLDVAETASRLGVSPVRVRQFVARGQLPATKFSGRIWVKISEVEKFAEKNRPPGRPKKISG